MKIMISFVFAIFLFSINVNAAWPIVKVCQNDNTEFTLQKLDDVPGKNRWLANITALDGPLPYHFTLISYLFTYGSNVSIVKWDRDVSIGDCRIGYASYAGKEVLFENVQDMAYFFEPRARQLRCVYGEIRISSNNLAFVIELEKPTGFPIIESMSVFEIAGGNLTDSAIEVCVPPTSIFGQTECGKKVKMDHPLISQGSQTREGDWPWHCTIFHSNNGTQRYLCGCTVIRSDAVVTAAHCVDLVAPERIIVHLGQHDLQLAGPHAQQIRAGRIIVHENFNSSNYQNDIALIHLADRMTFNEYVQPICWYPVYSVDLNTMVGRNSVLVSWRNEARQLNTVLHQITMSVVPHTDCEKLDPAFYEDLLKNNNTFCARFINGSSVYASDHGAGLYVEHEGTYYLQGIVSRAKAQNNGTNEYVVATNVGGYSSWINKHANELQDTNYPPVQYRGFAPDFEQKFSDEISRIKICENNFIRFTLTRINFVAPSLFEIVLPEPLTPGDVPHKTRWLGNITTTGLSLAEKTQFHLELDTFGRIPEIVAWDRDISDLSVLLTRSRVQHNSSALVNRKDILYASEDRFDFSFTGEAASSKEPTNHLAFVIEFDEETDYPIVERLSVLGIEVCQQLAVEPKERPPCGARVYDRLPLITRGLAAREGDWPWHCAIFHADGWQQSYQCGCTLIGPDTVVTAAHCVSLDGVGQSIIPERVFVHLGQYDIDLSGPNVQEFRAHRIIVHPNFGNSDLLNDIALIRLAKEATFTAFVQPICLWDSDRPDLNEVIGRDGISVGWGFNEHDKLSHALHLVRMPVVSDKECLRSAPGFYADFLAGNAFCAGFRNGSSVCNGDSGGGMYFQENGIFELRGIISLTKARSAVENFCDPTNFVVFTDVAPYLNWIKENSQLTKVESSD